MEIEPARRFKDANAFREALRRLGRNEMRAIENWSERSSSDASQPNVNVTIVNKPVAVDPFDSYSILKPAEIDWLVPRPSRRPFVIAGLIGMMLLGGVYAWSDADALDGFEKAAVDYVRPAKKDSSIADRKTANLKTNSLSVSRSATLSKELPGDPRGAKAQTKASTKRNRNSH
jgi:hypothetical protein